jgi:hypothetical protein
MGFLATPRTIGFLPCLLEYPAVLFDHNLLSLNALDPNELIENIEKILRTPEGNVNKPVPKFLLRRVIFAEVPGLRTY